MFLRHVAAAGRECDIPPAPPVMQLCSEDFSKSSPLRYTTYTRTDGFCPWTNPEF